VVLLFCDLAVQLLAASLFTALKNSILLYTASGSVILDLTCVTYALSLQWNIDQDHSSPSSSILCCHFRFPPAVLKVRCPYFFFYISPPSVFWPPPSYMALWCPIIIIMIISKTMFMVLSPRQSHCESSPGSSDECRTAPSGRRPKTKPDDLGCESACTGCQKLHPSSPFIIITQPES